MTRPEDKRARPQTGELVAPVSVIELGVAFTLFRRAALDEDEACEDLFRPLSDTHALATLSQKGFQRGMGLLRVHYDYPDSPNAGMRRIEAFVRLLRSQKAAPHGDWAVFSGSHDSFTPVLHVIAWCPLSPSGCFEVSDFMRFARSAPLSIAASPNF